MLISYDGIKLIVLNFNWINFYMFMAGSKYPVILEINLLHCFLFPCRLFVFLRQIVCPVGGNCELL
jgi:hypothetical protein